MESIFKEAAWQTIQNNSVNIIVLIGILVLMAKVSKNTIVICFAMFYASYIVADYSMTIIEMVIPQAHIGEYQRTWHILLGIVGALIMLFLSRYLPTISLYLKYSGYQVSLIHSS